MRSRPISRILRAVKHDRWPSDRFPAGRVFQSVWSETNPRGFERELEAPARWKSASNFARYRSAGAKNTSVVRSLVIEWKRWLALASTKTTLPVRTG